MPRKILVVDDDGTITKLLEARLTANDYVVVTAQNGQQGLEKAKAENPDLIISDVVMPEMDGFAFHKALKNDPATIKTPVLILSSRDKMEDTFRAMNVDDFITKPFDIQELLSTIEAKLNHVTSQEPPAPKVEEPKEEEKPPEPPKEEKPPEPKKEAPLPIVKKEEKKEKPPAEEKKEPEQVGFKAKVLVGGANALTAQMVKQLQDRKCRIETFDKWADLVIRAVDFKPDIIILDVIIDHKPPDKQIASLRKLKEFRKKPYIIVYSYFDKENLGDTSSIQRTADIEKGKVACMNSGANEILGEYEKNAFFKKVEEYLEKI